MGIPETTCCYSPRSAAPHKIKKCTEQTDTRHRSVGVSLLEVRKTHTHITEHFRLVEKSRIRISTPRLHSKSTSVCPGKALCRAPARSLNTTGTCSTCLLQLSGCTGHYHATIINLRDTNPVIKVNGYSLLTVKPVLHINGLINTVDISKYISGKATSEIKTPKGRQHQKEGPVPEVRLTGS